MSNRKNKTIKPRLLLINIQFLENITIVNDLVKKHNYVKIIFFDG